MSARKTKARLKLSFTWPTISIDVQRACETCDVCQKRRRVTIHDRVPISPIPRDGTVFDCWVIDIIGPIFPSQKLEYQYALVLCDSYSRYPVAFALRSITAKCVCVMPCYNCSRLLVFRRQLEVIVAVILQVS